MQSIYADVLTD